MNIARLSRCLRLLNVLRTGCRIGDLAREFEVSRRTVYRDLALLAEAGICVFYDTKRCCHAIRRDPDLRAAKLLPEELMALLLSAHIFSLSCSAEVGRPLRQAVGKLVAQTPMALRAEIMNLLTSVSGRPLPTLWPRASQSVIGEILAAIRSDNPLRIVYRTDDESASAVHTKISAHRLVATDGRWYLVGRSSWHRKVCRFDLQHIRHAGQAESSS
jgi:predicted DNA-binding transcriptional regulator YafY